MAAGNHEAKVVGPGCVIPTCITLPLDSLIPRPVRADEVPHVRRMWWNLTADGYRLPAERGVIMIEGGRR